MKISKNLVKLEKRLKEDLNIEVDISTFRRMYPGHWQRSEGAVSWIIKVKDERLGQMVASQWPVKELIKAKNIVSWINYGDIMVEPSIESMK